ncbi:hypothetical protein IJ707_02140 [bacterium]|nr:hypothetical protein [bacterium]
MLIKEGVIMARPKKKSERELILDAQNMDEKEVLNRIEELKARYDNILKKKKDAKLKSMRLTKDGVFDDLMEEFADLKAEFEACETLDDFEFFRKKVQYKIKFLCLFYELNKNLPVKEMPDLKEPKKEEEAKKEE